MNNQPKTAKVSAIKLERYTISFVVVEDLPPDQAKAFYEYLYKNRETTAGLDEYEGKTCAYYSDYENWYESWIVGKEAISFD